MTLDKYPIEESPERKAYRERAGITSKITVDAKTFKNAFEKDHGEQLDWNPKRLTNLKSIVAAGTKINAHPEVGMHDNGKLGVYDGRHRIAHAAELGMQIDVVAQPEDVPKIQDRLRRQEYLDQANHLLKS